MYKLFITYGLFFSLLSAQLSAQEQTRVTLKINLNVNTNELLVSQNIAYKNTEQKPIDTLYLNDWANAYSSIKSPLAARLVEEYNRSFYLSQKSKRGATNIEKITSNGKEIAWKRKENQLDILQIVPATPLQQNQTLELALNYRVQLPDGKFTGYGNLGNKNYFLENFFITVAYRKNGKWNPISHLDLEDVPTQAANYTIDFNLPQELQLIANIKPYKKTKNQTLATYSFGATNQKQLFFHIGEKLDYQTFQMETKEILTDLSEDDFSKARMHKSLRKIHTFITNELGEYPHQRILLSEKKYQKRPFYGLTLVPNLLKPFPTQFEFELKTLNTYLNHYLTENIALHPRDDFWLFGGIQTYLMMKYVQENYPNRALLELVMRQPLAKFFLSKYQFTQLTFEDTFIAFHEFMLRRNLQQPMLLNKEELVKFNEQIGNPSQLGSLFHYLEQTEAMDVSAFIKAVVETKQQTIPAREQFFNYAKKKNHSFLNHYLSQRKSLDFSFDQLERDKDSITLVVREKNNLLLPFQLGWYKNDSLIKKQSYAADKLNQSLQVQKEEADYLVINPTKRLPEFNPRDNWKKIKGLPIKPLRFTFIKDLENPRYNQLFYNPRINYNLYDGLSYGIRLNNKTIKPRPFLFTVVPFYASLEKTLVGSFSTSYSPLNEESNFYLKSLQLSGSSFHYDQKLRYTIFRSSINLYRRNGNLRNNQKERFRLFWQYIHRDRNLNQELTPNYNVGGLNYIYSNKGALNHLTFNTSLELSNEFTKFNLKAEARHLFPSGRQWSIRLFAGKFLWKKNNQVSFFDYSLDRPTDYLFQYNYLGRSETTGLVSQQFIPAEGGFKTTFDHPYADDYILTLNNSIGLWKWIELYGDIGLIKRKGQANRFLYDSGLRLNLVPDYFELFFPLVNSNGFEWQKKNYNEKIRFVIVLEPTTLQQLFSRKWL